MGIDYQFAFARNDHGPYSERLKDAFKEMELPRRSMAELVIDAQKCGAIPLRDIPKVIAEYDTPRFQEFEGGTVWTGFNAFTEVAKRRFEKNPVAASDGSRLMGKLFETRFPVCMS